MKVECAPGALGGTKFHADEDAAQVPPIRGGLPRAGLAWARTRMLAQTDNNAVFPVNF